MTLENMLRGSGDIGAMAATVWGLSQVNAESNTIFVQNVKARDFAPPEAFIIEGRPSIDQKGSFELTHPPGFAGVLGDHKNQGGRPPVPDKEAKRSQARELKQRGLSVRGIADEIGLSPTTVHRLVTNE